MDDIKRLIRYMKDRKGKYFAILIVTLAVAMIMELVYSYMYKMVFNSIEYQDEALFRRAVILCVTVLMFRLVQPYLRYFEMKQVRMIVFSIKLQMFDKLTGLTMHYFEEHHSGDTLKRLNQDANELKETYFSRVYQLFVLICRGAAAIIAMIIYSPLLACISILFSLTSVVMSVWINKVIKRMSKEIQKNVAKLTERLVDIFSGFLILKMYEGASIIKERYEEANDDVRMGMRKRTQVMSLLEMLSFLIGMVGNFGTILIGVFLVTKNKLDYGTVMGVVTLQMSVSNMFQYLGSALTSFTSSIAEAQRVFDFLELNEMEENEQKAGVSALDGSKGIDFKSVSFAYPGGEPVIQNLNLHVKPGERVMLTGESGCGKSSLLQMLLSFYDHKEGTIELFRRNIRDYSLEELHKLITYVPQESYLFHGTVRENIAYGFEGADEESIQKAAKLAYADEFIRQMPDGYDTILTAGGKNLSGGQRQRVAIARAFLKDSPILLLDEPSSALDVESEQKINQAIRHLMSSKIVLMVTHRTTSFEDFDRRFVMESQSRA